MSSSWDRTRAVADAVLYEGYLLYPYRGTSSKNQSRWQFGVLGPPGAATAGLGEDDTLAAQFLLEIVRPVVPKEPDVCLRQDRTVDDTRVDVLVHDDPVARAHERGDESDDCAEHMLHGLQQIFCDLVEKVGKSRDDDYEEHLLPHRQIVE